MRDEVWEDWSDIELWRVSCDRMDIYTISSRYLDVIKKTLYYHNSYNKATKHLFHIKLQNKPLTSIQL